jgi:hypothetical protein
MEAYVCKRAAADRAYAQQLKELNHTAYVSLCCLSAVSDRLPHHHVCRVGSGAFLPSMDPFSM